MNLTAKSVDELDCGFCNWLGGIADGEGSFQLKLNLRRWQMEFTLSLREDDRPVLEMIHRETGRGSCYPHLAKSPQHKSKPRYMVKFHNAPDIRFIIALFERYPLRSKKKQVFDLWTQARKELDKPTQARDRRYLRYLYRAIRDARKYEPSPIEIYEPEGKQMALAVQ